MEIAALSLEIIGQIISVFLIVITVGLCLVLAYVKIRDNQKTKTLSDDAESVIERNLELHAECAHDIWAHWTNYQLSICETDEHGNVIISQDKAERWQRLAQTRYADLSERDQRWDRDVAKQFIHPILEEHLKTHEPQ